MLQPPPPPQESLAGFQLLLEVLLSHLPDELQAPPSPKPAKVVSRIEAAGGLQSKATGSSKSEEMSGRYLRSRLRSLDAAVNCLQKIRRDLQESVTEAHKHEVLDKEVENRELRRRVRYLEAQLQRSQTGHSTLPTKVGDLQNLSTTRALVLFLNIGLTAVYNLEPKDVRLLDLANRSEPLSCDHLQWIKWQEQFDHLVSVNIAVHFSIS